MFTPYNEDTASLEDRIAWALCQIIDDDAPMRWTRYRSAAICIAANPEVMADLTALAEQRVQPFKGGQPGPVALFVRDADGAPADPLDLPLPADVQVGHTTFRKGVALRTFVTAAQRWHREAFPKGYTLTDEQKAANLAQLQACATAGVAVPAPSYRLLEHADIIQKGDEVLADDAVNWLPLVGWEVGTAWGCNLMPMRRPTAGVAGTKGGRR